MNRTGLRAHGVRFELLFEGLPFEHVCGSRVAIPTARAHMEPATIQLHFQRVAASFRRVARHVTQDVELVLLSPDALESAEQVVGVENGETARSFRQSSQDLLVGRSRRWKWRHDGPRLV